MLEFFALQVLISKHLYNVYNKMMKLELQVRNSLLYYALTLSVSDGYY